MMRLALLSAAAGVWADDDASLLQAHGKKTRRIATTNLVEDFAESPQEFLRYVASLSSSEQQSLLQQVVAAEPSTLANDLKAHSVAVALALRQSPMPSLSKASPQEWVSELQQQATTMDSSLAQKGKKDKNGTVDDTVKGKQKNLEGSVARKGRCKATHTYSEVNFTTVCEGLCADEANCDAFETEDGKCKRFNVPELNLTRTVCEETCQADANCTAFEFESPSECELHHGEIKGEGKNPKEALDGCFLLTRGVNATDNSTVFTAERDGAYCRTGNEFKDVKQSVACSDHCDKTANCTRSKVKDSKCEHKICN